MLWSVRRTAELGLDVYIVITEWKKRPDFYELPRSRIIERDDRIKSLTVGTFLGLLEEFGLVTLDRRNRQRPRIASFSSKLRPK